MEMTEPSHDAQQFGTEDSRDAFVAVFIPSKQRDGGPVDHEYWRGEALYRMSKLFGGATAVRGRGGWIDTKQGGRYTEEDNSIVFSFFAEERWHEQNVLGLKEFLYRMGREAKQGAVGFYLARRDMGTKYIEIPSECYEEEE